jgi:dTDP-4-dehydrorhamnose 3,5-epimerase
MQLTKTKIPEVLLIEPKVFSDERGFFMETWNKKKFKEAGLIIDFVQDNHSKSVKNTLRGLHYQIENPQGKLVRVIQGEVFDVAVDLRKNSPYYGNWVGETLTAENKKMLWVPPGFAHGFLVLSDTAEFQYKCSDFYNPQAERCIIWNDPEINIDWPIPKNEKPILSQKDKSGVLFKDAEVFE